MTVINMLLLMHIAGAVITLAVIALSFLLILLNKSNLYRNASVGLAGITLFQVITGSFLSLLSSDSVGTYCTRIATYMMLVVVTEFALLWKMKLDTFPMKFVYATLSLSLLVIVATAFGIYIS